MPDNERRSNNYALALRKYQDGALRSMKNIAQDASLGGGQQGFIAASRLLIEATAQ